MPFSMQTVALCTQLTPPHPTSYRTKNGKVPHGGTNGKMSMPPLMVKCLRGHY